MGNCCELAFIAATLFAKLRIMPLYGEHSLASCKVVYTLTVKLVEFQQESRQSTVHSI
jgi:hypothetical protein